MNACHRQDDFPDRNAEYLLYQTLVGAWPLSIDRAQSYMDKAAHESKQHTTWGKQNAAYEKALQNFISEILHDPEFTTSLEQFVGTLADAAMVNSLAQTLIKLTAPGVPDIYQGCELWDWSLVDPDNRRPVDFKLRQGRLAEVRKLSVDDIWKRRAEGLPKIWLIHKTLKLRKHHSDFADFNYEPLRTQGLRAEHVIAFSRGGKILTVVPRFWSKLNHHWQNTAMELPAGTWCNEFTGRFFDGEIKMEELFRIFPVALLTRKENE